ncbi:hypothetical protein [Rhizobium wuzhouense]|uniref:Uncharacterized protein n=1 Tax=Rhizobium wuzhouense TaxID=1986026 RepID=A0ABX5NZI1_9HYPH|nr:hypothetical protein [Rhizobium wuzhouense]PYB77101.1 hypothetical protein DMY87_01620 [Rhizobium wuzhouense]
MNRPLAIIVLLLLAGVLPVVRPMPSLAAVLLTAPSLLLLPTGLGLCAAYGVTGRRPAGLTALQALLLAYFVGLFLFILLFVASERLLADPPRPGLLMAGLWLSALAGWLRMRPLLAIPREAVSPLLLVCAIALPLVVLRYAYGIWIYSDYPITDLFQRSHFHGAAFEFARSQILNPFAANSYIPFQQLFLGMLMRLTGADPLDAEWVWPLAMAPLQIATLLCCIERLLPNRRMAFSALAIALAQFPLSNPTNSSMAEMVVIVLLSVLLPQRDRTMSSAVTSVKLLAVVPALLIGFAVTKVPVEMAISLTVVLVLAGNLTRPSLLVQIWPVVVLTVIALPFHRGALLFIAFVLILVCGLSLLSSLRLRFIAVSRGVVLATVGVLSLLAAMCLKILVFSRRESDIFGLFRLFDLVLTPITGKSLANVAIDGDLAPGVGARVALFEVARTISPLAVLLMVIGVFVMLRLFVWRRVPGPSPSEDVREIHLLADITLLFFGFIVLILTGFPFVHRAAFLVTLLASVALAIIVSNDSMALKSYRSLLSLVLSYLLLLIAIPFLVSSERAEPYLMRALPLLLVTLCVGLFAVLLALSWGRRRNLPLVLAVVVAVAMEFAVSRSYFKSYAFQNQPPPANASLAAYDRTDLETARRVLTLSGGGEVLVSDPKTMTIMRSRTGLYPLVASSNLDTLSSEASSQLMAVLTTVLSPSPLAETCHRLMQVASSNASGLYNYGSIRRLSPAADGVGILTTLGYNNRLVPTYDPVIAAVQRKEAVASIVQLKEAEASIQRQFLILVNGSTVYWLANHRTLSYFPIHRALSNDLLSVLAQKYPGGHLMEETFVARLECR